MKKRSLIFVLALMLVFAAAAAPQKKVDAKTKSWYGKYWELSKTSKKACKIKGNKIILKGHWANAVSKAALADTKTKKIKKTFKLNSKTKYYIRKTSDAKLKKVSKKKFKKWLHSDVTYCSLKIRYGKVVKAILETN